MSKPCVFIPSWHIILYSPVGTLCPLKPDPHGGQTPCPCPHVHSFLAGWGGQGEDRKNHTGQDKPIRTASVLFQKTLIIFRTTTRDGQGHALVHSGLIAHQDYLILIAVNNAFPPTRLVYQLAPWVIHSLEYIRARVVVEAIPCYKNGGFGQQTVSLGDSHFVSSPSPS